MRRGGGSGEGKVRSPKWNMNCRQPNKFALEINMSDAVCNSTVTVVMH